MYFVILRSRLPKASSTFAWRPCCEAMSAFTLSLRVNRKNGLLGGISANINLLAMLLTPLAPMD